MVDQAYNFIRPTHRCRICGAYWKEWADSWSLTSNGCGECCDQKHMGDQIVTLVDHDRSYDLSSYLCRLEKYGKYLIENEDAALKVLVDIGICDENGDLTENYRD